MFSYRRELDGLRALAVLAVIIYHANLKISGFQLLQGGFFGVDVFFVLSGYLITAIIRSDMEKASFSFFSFYWRRAKRIIPALLVMLAATSIMAYMVLLPSDLTNYAKSLKSALYFGSNYHFYNEDSYVADASIYKPLLHTWSLAIEWQFYLIYPFVLWFINRFFKQYMFEVLLGLALISLQYSSFIVADFPDMAFYLLPSRAWELLLGGLTTFYNRDRFSIAEKSDLGKVFFKTLPLLGIFLIAHSMLFIGHEVKHPSFITLLPVIGTCMFLMFSGKGELSSDLLSTKPFVCIGLVSYSLYLWHQPVFVFFRFIKHDYFRYEQLALLVIISLLLAVLTYGFVENTFRKKGLNRYLLSLPLIVFILLAFFIGRTIKYNGFPDRLAGSVKEAYDMYKQKEFRRLEQPEYLGNSYRGEIGTRSQCNFRSVETACRFDDESWVTIGDSYVGQYDYVLHEITKKTSEGMISLAYEQCPFVSPSIWFGNVPECSIVNEERIKLISSFDSPKKFIVATNYNQFDAPKSRTKSPLEDGKNNFSGGDIIKTDIAWKSYAENINKLLALGHQVYVVYPVPNPGTDVEKAVFQQLTTSVSKYKNAWSLEKNTYNSTVERSKKLDSYLPIHQNLHKVMPQELLCSEGRCKIIDAKYGGLYNGGSHLSYAGAKIILSDIFHDVD